MILAQFANPIILPGFIVVIGLGHYFTIRSRRRQSQEMTQ
jgi:preprotein translocase subunit YajC